MRAAADAVQLGIKRIGKFASGGVTAAPDNRPSCRIQRLRMSVDEFGPGVFIAIGAGAGQREIFEVERIVIPREVVLFRRAVWKSSQRAFFEGLCKALRGEIPTCRFGFGIIDRAVSGGRVCGLANCGVAFHGSRIAQHRYQFSASNSIVFGGGCRRGFEIAAAY